MANFDLVIKGGNLVIPDVGIQKADIGIKDEKIGAIAQSIPTGNSTRIVDASGKYVFPGAIDSHFHVGIYRPFEDDATSE